MSEIVAPLAAKGDLQLAPRFPVPWALSCIVAAWLMLPLTSAADDGLDRIRQRGTLVWGADQEGGGPFIYPAPDDPTVLVGFEVELPD